MLLPHLPETAQNELFVHLIIRFLALTLFFPFKMPFNTWSLKSLFANQQKTVSRVPLS